MNTLKGGNLPKAFYIPAIQGFISVADYNALYRKCKANPNVSVPMTISKWWGGTTDDIIAEIVAGIHDRINKRK